MSVPVQVTYTFNSQIFFDIGMIFKFVGVMEGVLDGIIVEVLGFKGWEICGDMEGVEEWDIEDVEELSSLGRTQESSFI